MTLGQSLRFEGHFVGGAGLTHAHLKLKPFVNGVKSCLDKGRAHVQETPEIREAPRRDVT